MQDRVVPERDNSDQNIRPEGSVLQDTDCCLMFLGEKLPNRFPLLLILDPREQLRAQLRDRLGTIERKALIHLAPGEVAGLAALLEDRLHGLFE